MSEMTRTTVNLLYTSPSESLFTSSPATGYGKSARNSRPLSGRCQHAFFGTAQTVPWTTASQVCLQLQIDEHVPKNEP